MPELLLLLQLLPTLEPTFESVVPILTAAINGTPPTDAQIATLIAARQAIEAQAKAGA